MRPASGSIAFLVSLTQPPGPPIPPPRITVAPRQVVGRQPWREGKSKTMLDKYQAPVSKRKQLRVKPLVSRSSLKRSRHSPPTQLIDHQRHDEKRVITPLLQMLAYDVPDAIGLEHAVVQALRTEKDLADRWR